MPTFLPSSSLLTPKIYIFLPSWLRNPLSLPRNTNKTSNNVDLESIIPQDIGQENAAETQVEKARQNFT